MVKAFLESIESGINSLNNWSSPKKIAEHTNWAVEDVLEALKHLVEEGKILSRKKGRGHQYGPKNIKELKEKEEVINSEPKVEKIYEPPPPSDTTFTSLDEFLLEGSKALPKDKAFTADEFGQALLAAFTKTVWKKSDVVGGIGKLVRLGRLDLCPYMDDQALKYQYVVK